MLAKVVLLMQGPVIPQIVFLLQLALPPRLLLLSVNGNIVQRGRMLHPCVSACVSGRAITVADTIRKAGLDRHKVFSLPQEAQRTIPDYFVIVGRGSVRPPTPTAQVEVFAGMLRW